VLLAFCAFSWNLLLFGVGIIQVLVGFVCIMGIMLRASDCWFVLRGLV